MRDYVVTLSHGIIVFVRAELFIVNYETDDSAGFVSFYSNSDEVVSFFEKDVFEVDIHHDDDSLEKVLGFF